MSIGILYNHESPLRPPQFISKKIVNTAIAIKNKNQDKLVVGNLNAKVDWGYAVDYVDAMHKILQLPLAEDFVISSGSIHTVKDFVKGVFEYLNLDWSKYVKEDPSLIVKKEKPNLQGNSQKLTSKTGWHSSTNLADLIKIMVKDGMKNNDKK